MKTRIASLFAMLLIASTASAGPLPTWDYTASFSGDRGSAYVDVGYSARQDSSSSTGLRYYQGYVQLIAAGHTGTVSNASTGTILLGTTPGNTEFYWALDEEHAPPTPPVDNAPLPSGKLDSMFTAAITIKDTASGQSNTVSLTKRVDFNGDPWLGQPADLIPDYAVQNRDFTMGGNRYHVTLHEEKIGVQPGVMGQPEWRELRILADVSVSPIDTPEPGTLILGGIGLMGVFGARFRRSSTMTG